MKNIIQLMKVNESPFLLTEALTYFPIQSSLELLALLARPNPFSLCKVTNPFSTTVLNLCTSIVQIHCMIVLQLHGIKDYVFFTTTNVLISLKQDQVFVKVWYCDDLSHIRDKDIS